MRKQRSYGGKLTALLLAAVLTLGLVPIRASAAGTAHFKDVPSTHWAYSYVERAYSDRAISGTGGDPAKGTGADPLVRPGDSGGLQPPTDLYLPGRPDEQVRGRFHQPL